MTRMSQSCAARLSAAAAFVLLVAAFSGGPLLVAQSPQAADIVLGDSIEVGLGDDIPEDGMGYVPIVHGLLSSVLGDVTLHNFAVPSARVRDIWRVQLPQALTVISAQAPVVVMWGGGGNDLLSIATGPQAAACGQFASCVSRFNALLNEVEETIDRTIEQLRAAVGPTGRIVMRTQYNGLRRGVCTTPVSPEAVLLGDVTLEGAPGTILERGLNDRIRSVAARYDARVVELFGVFAVFAGTLVSPDCVHPNGLGYQVIAERTWEAIAPLP
jgi:lysophospholipase L1-like esterase